MYRYRNFERGGGREYREEFHEGDQVRHIDNFELSGKVITLQKTLDDRIELVIETPDGEILDPIDSSNFEKI